MIFLSMKNEFKKKKWHIYLEEEMVILKRNFFSPKHYFQDRDVKIIKVMKLA